MTNQTNRSDQPLDAELDGALRQMAKEIHPRPAFVAKLRGELAQEAASPRRGLWSLLTRARPWLAQAVLIAALAALVLVAGTLAGRLFAPDRGEFREIGANLTPAAANASASLPVGALARLGKGQIQSIDAAPDGRIVVGSKAGLCVYNTGLSPDWCRWTDAPVHAAMFDPSGTRLAVRYGTKPDVEIWDAAQGQVITSHTFAEPASPISGEAPLAAFWNIGMAWEPSQSGLESRLAVTENNRSLSLWDWQQDKIDWGPVTLDEVPLSIDWAAGPGGESLLAVLTQANVHLFNGETGEQTGGIEGLFPSALIGLSALDFASDGTWMSVAMPGGISWIALDGSRPASVQMVQEGVDVMRLALSPDGALMAAQNGEEILTYDLRTGQLVASIRSMAVSPMTWNPADRRLYYASPDGSLASFDGRLEGAVIVSGHTLAPQFAAWREDGTVVTLAGRYLYRWDPSTQSLASFSEMTIVDTVMPVGLSKDGSRALYFDPTNNTTVMWDVEQNQPLHELRSSGVLHGVTLSPDGTCIAAVNEDGQIFTWKLLDNGSEERDLTGISGFTSVEALAFHPNGEQIAVAYTKTDGSPALEVHDIASQQMIADLPLVQHLPTTEPITELSWSEDGQYLGASQGLGTVVWEISSWNRRTWFLPEVEASPPSLRAFAFNGALGMASASKDIFYHDWSTEAQHTYSGHTMTVTDLAFRPDGEALASTSNDGTVILWNLRSASLPPVEVQPTDTPLPLPTATAITLQEYTVVDGDTCSGIAFTFNVSVESLIALNGLSPNCDSLVVGQVLRIPYPTPTPHPDYPAPMDPTGTAIAEAYPEPGFTTTPTPTPTAQQGEPTPLPNATEHAMPDTTGYDVTQADGISPSFQWRWIAIRGEWQPGAPREEDLNVIIAASTDGLQTWVLEEWTPHGLGEGWPTGFSFSADDRYLLFYDSGTPDGCGQPWQGNLRRMDLLTGIVEPVEPLGPDYYGRLTLAPDASRVAVVEGSEIGIFYPINNQPARQIPFTFTEAADWSRSEIRWSPLPSTLIAFEIVSPPESPCDPPLPDQQRWTVVASIDGGNSWTFANPPGSFWAGWETGLNWGPDGRIIYETMDGTRIMVDPRTGEIAP